MCMLFVVVVVVFKELGFSLLKLELFVKENVVFVLLGKMKME